MILRFAESQSGTVLVSLDVISLRLGLSMCADGRHLMRSWPLGSEEGDRILQAVGVNKIALVSGSAPTL